MSSLRERLLKQSFQYTLGTFVSLLASVLRAGVGARLISTHDMGVWVAIQVATSYASNLHFGTIFAMFRSVPMLVARGEMAAAAEELRTSWSFVVGVSVAMFVGGLVVCGLLRTEISFVNIALGAGLAATNLARGWYVSAYKAERRFGELSASSGIGALISLAGVALIPKFGLSGLIGGALAQYASEIAILAARRAALGIRISRTVLVGQIKFGMLTLLATVGGIVITSVDRTVMLRMLGTSAAGLFSIGAQVATLIPLVATVPSAVLTPVIFQRAGHGEDFLPVIERANALIANLFGWVITIGCIAVPPAIALLWPHLAASVPACELSLIGTLPYILAGMFGNVFYALDRQWPQVAILAASSAAMFGAATAGVYLTHDIAGACAGTALGMFLYLGLSAVIGFRFCGRPAWMALVSVGRTLAPLGCGLVVMVVAGVALRRLGPATAVIPAALNAAIVTVVMLPFLGRAVAIVRGTATA